VAKAEMGRDRKLRGVVQARIPEPANPAHLEVRDRRVPVRHGAPPGPGVQVDAAQAERGWYQRGAGYSVRVPHTVARLRRVEGFAVEKQLGVELARPPAVVRAAKRVLGATCIRFRTSASTRISSSARCPPSKT